MLRYCKHRHPVATQKIVRRRTSDALVIKNIVRDSCGNPPFFGTASFRTSDVKYYFITHASKERFSALFFGPKKAVYRRFVGFLASSAGRIFWELYLTKNTQIMGNSLTTVSGTCLNMFSAFLSLN